MKNTRVPRVCPSQDVRPVTEFRAHASAFLDQVRVTRRAMILTQHGRCAAVLLDVSVYEELLGELTVLRETRPVGHPHTPAPDDDTLARPTDPHSVPLT
ncbi:MAG TPA: type II toxin-antitoxin system Phd/YefM family antitoxin [Gemmatimonadales bacterium]|nr:type II toxin-antitoxin system Phd/YefM family antitoxin [Gemmatimonadales bacterium]